MSDVTPVSILGKISEGPYFLTLQAYKADDAVELTFLGSACRHLIQK